MERNCCEQHTNSHAQNSDLQNCTASETIDEDKVDQGEDEIGSRNDNGDGCSIREANNIEESCRIVLSYC